jgi:hypothetical protein
MDDEKTIAELVAEDEDNDEAIDDAKDKLEDADDIDADEEMREDEAEGDETRELLDKIMARLDGIEAHLDARIDGLSRIFLDGGGVIRDGGAEDAVVIDPEGYIDFDDMDLDVD